MSVHLNDNRINEDPEHIEEVLDIFGLREEDLVELNRQHQHQKQIFLRDKDEIDQIKKREEYQHIDYKKIIQTHLRTEGPIK